VNICLLLNSSTTAATTLPSRCHHLRQCMSMLLLS
jgi:hypothetical protein